MRIPITLTELPRSKNPYTASQIFASQALDSARLTPASSSFPLDCSHESPQFTRLLSMKILQSRMKTVHTFVRKVSLPLSRGPVRDPTKVPLSCSPPSSHRRVPFPILCSHESSQSSAGLERGGGKGREGKERQGDGDGVLCAALFSLFSLPYQALRCAKNLYYTCCIPFLRIFKKF